MRRYLESTRYQLPVLLDPDFSITRDYRITGLPTHFFIDRRGEAARHRHRGPEAERDARPPGPDQRVAPARRSEQRLRGAGRGGAAPRRQARRHVQVPARTTSPAAAGSSRRRRSSPRCPCSSAGRGRAPGRGPARCSACAQAAVGRDAAGEGDLGHAQALGGGAGLPHQHVHHRLLEVGGEQGRPLRVEAPGWRPLPVGAGRGCPPGRRAPPCARRSTAVLRPLKLKSSLPRSQGRVRRRARGTLAGSTALAARSTAGPPGVAQARGCGPPCRRPRRRRRRGCARAGAKRPWPVIRTSSVWPPETTRQSSGKRGARRRPPSQLA